MTLPILVTAVFLALDFRMQIELNIETEQIVFQVSWMPVNAMMNIEMQHIYEFHPSQDDIDDSDEVESVEEETEGDSDDEDDDYEFEGENGNVLNRSDESENATSGFII